MTQVRGYYDSETHTFRCDSTDCGHVSPLCVELSPVGFFQIAELHDRFAKLFPEGGTHEWHAILEREQDLPSLEDIASADIVRSNVPCSNCGADPKVLKNEIAPVLIAGKPYCYGCAFLFAREYLKHV